MLNQKRTLMIQKSLLTFAAILSTIMPLLLTVGPATAQGNGRLVSTATTEALGPTDPAELEAFLDALISRQMEEHHIPGAAVSVVKDGQLLFAKGYGYADLENKIPIDQVPERNGVELSRATALSKSYQESDS